MTLIKSISGIRGTIGGNPGEGLTPIDIMNISYGYSCFLKEKHKTSRIKVVIGRDARISGDMVNKIITATLQSTGIDVIDGGLCSTPSTGIAVKDYKAQGGIIITASHNPKNWNALKLLNENGEFLSDSDGKKVLKFSDDKKRFETIDKIGEYYKDENFTINHIEKILSLSLVDTAAISKAGLTVAVDAINSVGGIAIPMLLEALKVKNIIKVNCEPNGLFDHDPEPLPSNLTKLSSQVVKNKADVGFAVDPDVDRLALICENGEPFGEEYTLVAIADYIIKNHKENNITTVSNLSSTQALSDITERHGGKHYSCAVGEVNVVEKMKKVNAIIGGEGNGGVIYPKIHYGRDALTGIAIFLTALAKSKNTCSSLRKTLPDYIISKNKIELKKGVNTDDILNKISEKYKDHHLNKEDGVKIIFDKEWIHLRKSNTEPIIRIYSESNSKEKAEQLAKKIIDDINSLL